MGISKEEYELWKKEQRKERKKSRRKKKQDQKKNKPSDQMLYDNVMNYMLFNKVNSQILDAKDYAIDIKTGEISTPETTPIIQGEIQPRFNSWEEFLAETTEAERLKWCLSKANKANQERLMSGRAQSRLSKFDVWKILEGSKGVCFHCGSIALERRPSNDLGRPLPWSYMGRRIGSLDHIVCRFKNGDNNLDNLVWSCLWCNTWPSERKPGAIDHGGLHL